MCCWAVLRIWPDFWRRWSRWWLLGSLSCNVISAVLLVGTAVSAAGMLPLWPFSPSALLFARLLGGIGRGTSHQFRMATLPHMTQVDDRFNLVVWLHIAMSVGSGLGPLVVGTMKVLDPCHGLPPDFLVAGPAQLIITVSVLVVVAVFFPGRVDGVHDNEVVSGSDRKEPPLDRVVVVLTIAMTMLTCLVLSGLEVTTSLLLEGLYEWHQAAIGMVVGSTFLLSVPSFCIYRACQDKLSLAGWVRLPGFCSLAGCMLLLHLRHAYSLLLADMLCFPALCLLEGLVNGIRYSRLGPDGSIFDANTSYLWSSLASAGIGRFLGPWIARWSAEAGGRLLYAALQMGFSFATLLLFELFIWPRLHEKPK